MRASHRRTRLSVTDQEWRQRFICEILVRPEDMDLTGVLYLKVRIAGKDNLRTRRGNVQGKVETPQDDSLSWTLVRGRCRAILPAILAAVAALLFTGFSSREEKAVGSALVHDNKEQNIR